MRTTCNLMDDVLYLRCECIQVTDKQLLRSYEGLLTAEEHAHMMEGSTSAVRKERLLARVLVRTTLSRCALLYIHSVKSFLHTCPARLIHVSALPLAAFMHKHLQKHLVKRKNPPLCDPLNWSIAIVICGKG